MKLKEKYNRIQIDAAAPRAVGETLCPDQQMGISESDCAKFIGHLNATLDDYQLPQQERSDVIGFI